MKGKIILILAALIFVLAATSVNAQEVVISPNPTSTPTPTPVQYTLPYPGILPGNPLYFFKIMRDKIVYFLISNPLKKAEFDLLQADKDLSATISLFQQKRNDPVVFQTLHESEEHFQKSIVKAQEADKQGLDMSDLVARLKIANLKYQEVVANFIKDTQGDEQKAFTLEAEKLKKQNQTVEKLLHK
ncbi:MAG TPA: DUF5667 domain-containing protein [Patescibacteria group bacterium]